MAAAEWLPDTPIAFPIMLSCCHNTIGSGSCRSLVKTLEAKQVKKWKKFHLWVLCKGNLELKCERKVRSDTVIGEPLGECMRNDCKASSASTLTLPGIGMVIRGEARFAKTQRRIARRRCCPSSDRLLDAFCI